MEPTGPAHPRQATRWLPGLAVAVALALPAFALGHGVPTVGGPVFGIVLGTAVGALLRRHGPPGAEDRLDPGLAVASRQILQLAVVVLGAGLPLQQVLRTGADSLPVMLGTLAAALLGAWWLGRTLGIDGETTLLIGVGTGICGASAIAATSTVVDAARARVAYAMATIVTFNVAAVLVFPPLGHALGLSQEAFGLWSGTAINDTSSVVAAASGYGAQAGADAVVVKMARTMMIVPICGALLLWTARRQRAGRADDRAAAGNPGERESTGEQRGAAGRVRAAFPLIVPGFLAASAAATLGVVPGSWGSALSQLSGFLITVALAGIGLGLRFSQLRAAGSRPLLLGGALWLTVSATALVLQALTGHW